MSELTEKVSDFLKVLCDQTRLEILELLKNGEKTSEEIQEALHKTQSTISLQLKRLTDGNIIEFEKKKEEKVTMNYYRVKYGYIFKLLSDIQSFVITLQKDKVEKLLELDKIDTLF